MSAAAKSRMVIVASKPWATTSTGESPSTNSSFTWGWAARKRLQIGAITATMAPVLMCSRSEPEALARSRSSSASA